VAAWGAGFSTESYGPNAVGVVMLFDDEAGASFGIRLMRDDLASTMGSTDAAPTPFGGGSLCDESIGMQQQGGFSGRMYALFWRVENVMLVISWGAIDESHFRSLAEAMDARIGEPSAAWRPRPPGPS